MPVYLIAAVNKYDGADNLAEYDRYVAGGGASLATYDVEALASDEDPQVIEGKLPGRKMVLLKFRDRAHLDAWYKSSEYQAVLPLRHNNSDTEFLVAIDGLA